MPEISEQLLQAIQESAGAQKFDLPDDGLAIVSANGKQFQTFYPKTEVQLREEQRKLTRVEWVSLTTLAGLAQFVQRLAASNSDLRLAVRVTSPTQVDLIDFSDDTDRQVYVIVTPPHLPSIRIIDNAISLNDALIEMQECFATDDDVAKIVEALSTVKIEDLAELTDNGISKEVTFRSRVTGGKNADANVTGLQLRPLRTFPEVEIVPAEFSFRWQRTGEKAVSARLVERQRHLWVYRQTMVIAQKITELLPDIPVLV